MHPGSKACSILSPIVETVKSEMVGQELIQTGDATPLCPEQSGWGVSLRDASTLYTALPPELLPPSRPDRFVVGLNKTKTRNSLALDGTLSSIMTIKMADLEPCFKWEPPSDVLKASKKATGQYNRAHRS
ncbi:unnamed protein product [Boreogadus saida]